MIAPNTTEKQFNEVEAEVLGHDELFPDDLDITKAEFIAWKLNRCIVHIVFEHMVKKPESKYTRERFEHIINSTHNIQIGPELCKRLFEHSHVPYFEPEDIEFRDDDGNERMERQSDIEGACSKIKREAGRKFIIFGFKIRHRTMCLLCYGAVLVLLMTELLFSPMIVLMMMKKWKCRFL